jgi:acyl-coenzyme A synthetase/AMP-(fatty) acid ligase
VRWHHWLDFGSGHWRLSELFEAPARRHPTLPIQLDRPLDIKSGLGTTMRLDQVARLTIETADRLREAGVGPGDRVAVMKKQNLDVCMLASALARIGAVPALVSPDLDAPTVGKLLERLGSPHVITDRPVREAGRLPETDLPALARSVLTVHDGDLSIERFQAPGDGTGRLPAEVVLITHTSGTTDVPKLVGYADESIDEHTALQIGITRMLRMREAAAVFLSVVHGRMYSALGVVLNRGFPLLLLTNPDPRSAGPLMAEVQPGILETFPNVYLYWEQLADDPSRPLANVKYFVSTFDAVHPRSIKRLLGASERRLAMYVQGYGTTEMGPLTIKVYTRSIAERAAGRCVGHSVPGFTRVRVKQRRDSAVRAIDGRSPGAARLYVGEPERPSPAGGRRWWPTGDVGFRSKWGCIHLLDRAVDEPPEVRSALLVEDELLERLPQVSEVLVLPVAGSLPRPVVCTTDGQPLPGDLWTQAVSGKRMAEPIFCTWDSIPRTTTWKVRRLELRRQLEAGRFPPVATAGETLGPSR